MSGFTRTSTGCTRPASRATSLEQRRAPDAASSTTSPTPASTARRELRRATCCCRAPRFDRRVDAGAQRDLAARRARRRPRRARARRAGAACRRTRTPWSRTPRARPARTPANASSHARSPQRSHVRRVVGDHRRAVGLGELAPHAHRRCAARRPAHRRCGGGCGASWSNITASLRHACSSRSSTAKPFAAHGEQDPRQPRCLGTVASRHPCRRCS